MSFASRPRYSLFLGMAVVFVLAFASSRWYQLHSEPLIEIQADSAKYLTAAYNLYVHEAHSLAPPSVGRRPQSRTDLAVGYPMFLSLFFSSPPDSRTLLPRVRLAQSVLFALSAAAVVLLGSTALPLWASLIAGILTALNPHLIALSAAMLTETLFVVFVCLGLVLFTRGWLLARPLLVFLGIAVFAIAAEVRTIGIVLPVLLSPLCLVCPLKDGGRGAGRRGLMLLASGIAIVLGLCLHQMLLSRYGTNDAGERAAAEYQRFGAPFSALRTSMRPPNYVVEGLSHSLADHADPRWRERSDVGFAQAPLAYLEWNLWERWRVMWAFRSAYTGTAEPYPMRVSAFGGALQPIHTLMRLLHWPLAFAALVGSFAVLTLRAGFHEFAPRRADALLPAAVAFAGLLVALASIDWLPRYTVPLRPVSYLLAMVGLAALLDAWTRGFHRGRKDAAAS